MAEISKGYRRSGIRRWWCMALPGFTALLLICCPLHAAAQFTVHFENAQNESFDVKYVSEPDSSSSVSNHLIREIAKGIPRRYDFTSYQVTFRQVLRVISTEAGQYEVNIDINETKCHGDVVYKGFDISDVLIPNKIRIRATLLNKYKQVVKVFEIGDGSLHWGYNKLVTYHFSDTIREPQFTFQMESRKIWYDSAAISAFENKQMLIDQYYLSKAAIAQGMKKLDGFNFANVDMILVYDIMLNEVEKQVEELFAYDFPGQLNLSANDPIGFIDLFMAFSERTRQIRQQEDQALATLDKIYYEKGMKLLEQKETDKALVCFKRSYSYNPYYVPSYYQHAKVLYVRDSASYAARMIGRVLTTMNPDPVFHDSVVTFGEKLYSTLLQQGKDLLVLQKYNEALVVMEEALAFCSPGKGIRCSDELFTDFALARHGVYRSYLEVSEKAIQNGRFELAEVYIGEARKYQAANSRDIIGDAAADAVTEKLVKALRVKADTLSSRKKFEQALEFCLKARSLCTEGEGIRCDEDLEKAFRKAHNGIYERMLLLALGEADMRQTDAAEKRLQEARNYQQQYPDYISYTLPLDTIERKIWQIRYDSWIAEGRTLAAYHTAEDAHRLFSQSKAAEKKYRLRPDPALDSLLMINARPLLDTIYEAFSRNLKEARYDTADVHVKLMEQVMLESGWNKDPLLSEKLEQSKVLLHRAICGANAAKAGLIADSAETAFRLKNYPSGIAYLEDALAVLRTHPECRADSSFIINELNRCKPAAGYQRSLSLAQQKLHAGDTLNYFNLYYEADQRFRSITAAEFGLSHELLLDHICRRAEKQWLKKGFVFYAGRNAPDTSLLVLRAAMNHFIPATDFLSEQMRLGEMLGRRDASLIPGADPKEKLLQYPVSEKWFAVFRKTYLKTFKAALNGR